MGEPGHRTDVDDRRVGVLAQAGVGKATHLEGGDEIGLEQRAHLGLFVLQRALAHVRADVVDEQRQRRVEIRDPVEHLQTLLAFGDIGGEGENLALRKLLGDVGARLLQMRLVARDHQHIRAERGELARAGEADALAGAGDETGLAVQSPTGRICGHGTRSPLVCRGNPAQTVLVPAGHCHDPAQSHPVARQPARRARRV